ncbi:MAG TPA: hypothetical protein VN814_02320 [Caulobacteraceae bacterium]|nr:hypothetical protein [Caulobacteraceae bacterium]
MDGKVATLAGLAALVAAPALATPTAPAVQPASSYAELLQPIPNATERLKLADAQEQADAPRLIPAQWGRDHHHHHHHHHHNRAWWLSHGYFWSGGRWLLRPVHHHHHHHHHDDRGY